MTENGWKAAARAGKVHRNPIKPKGGSEKHCYVYVPPSWLGERVLALIGVTDVSMDEGSDGVAVLCHAQDFDRPTPYKRGTSAAVWVHGDYEGHDAILLLEPEHFAMERLREDEDGDEDGN